MVKCQQGRSQPHSSGWAIPPVSSDQFFLFFQNTFLIFFLILALRVGESPTWKDPGYAAECQKSLLQRYLKYHMICLVPITQMHKKSPSKQQIEYKMSLQTVCNLISNVATSENIIYFIKFKAVSNSTIAR